MDEYDNKMEIETINLIAKTTLWARDNLLNQFVRNVDVNKLIKEETDDVWLKSIVKRSVSLIRLQNITIFILSASYL